MAGSRTEDSNITKLRQLVENTQTLFKGLLETGKNNPQIVAVFLDNKTIEEYTIFLKTTSKLLEQQQPDNETIKNVTQDLQQIHDDLTSKKKSIDDDIKQKIEEIKKQSDGLLNKLKAAEKAVSMLAPQDNVTLQSIQDDLKIAEQYNNRYTSTTPAPPENYTHALIELAAVENRFKQHADQIKKLQPQQQSSQPADASTASSSASAAPPVNAASAPQPSTTQQKQAWKRVTPSQQQQAGAQQPVAQPQQPAAQPQQPAAQPLTQAELKQINSFEKNISHYEARLKSFTELTEQAVHSQFDRTRVKKIEGSIQSTISKMEQDLKDYVGLLNKQSSSGSVPPSHQAKLDRANSCLTTINEARNNIAKLKTPQTTIAHWSEQASSEKDMNDALTKVEQFLNQSAPSAPALTISSYGLQTTKIDPTKPIVVRCQTLNEKSNIESVDPVTNKTTTKLQDVTIKSASVQYTDANSSTRADIYLIPDDLTKLAGIPPQSNNKLIGKIDIPGAAVMEAAKYRLKEFVADPNVKLPIKILNRNMPANFVEALVITSASLGIPCMPPAGFKTDNLKKKVEFYDSLLQKANADMNAAMQTTPSNRKP